MKLMGSCLVTQSSMVSSVTLKSWLSACCSTGFLVQEAGYGSTNWHSDLRMTPLDTNDFVTAWIPFRDIKVTPGDASASQHHSATALQCSAKVGG